MFLNECHITIIIIDNVALLSSIQVVSLDTKWQIIEFDGVIIIRRIKNVIKMTTFFLYTSSIVNIAIFSNKVLEIDETKDGFQKTKIFKDLTISISKILLFYTKSALPGTEKQLVIDISMQIT